MKMTSRELLVSAAGAAHDLHSPAALSRSKATLSIKCSCGEVFSVPNTEENSNTLRNVPALDRS